MNTPKSELKSVEHRDLEVHSFESLSKVTGYSRANIHELYAAGRIKVFLSSITKWSNMLVLTKKEVARITGLKSQDKEARAQARAAEKLKEKQKKAVQRARKRLRKLNKELLSR